MFWKSYHCWWFIVERKSSVLFLPKGICHPLLNCDRRGQLFRFDTLLITQFGFVFEVSFWCIVWGKSVCIVPSGTVKLFLNIVKYFHFSDSNKTMLKSPSRYAVKNTLDSSIFQARVIAPNCNTQTCLCLIYSLGSQLWSLHWFFFSSCAVVQTIDCFMCLVYPEYLLVIKILHAWDLCLEAYEKHFFTPFISSVHSGWQLQRS